MSLLELLQNGPVIAEGVVVEADEAPVLGSNNWEFRHPDACSEATAGSPRSGINVSKSRLLLSNLRTMN